MRLSLHFNTYSLQHKNINHPDKCDRCIHFDVDSTCDRSLSRDSHSHRAAYNNRHNLQHTNFYKLARTLHIQWLTKISGTIFNNDRHVYLNYNFNADSTCDTQLSYPAETQSAMDRHCRWLCHGGDYDISRAHEARCFQHTEVRHVVHHDVEVRLHAGDDIAVVPHVTTANAQVHFIHELALMDQQLQSVEQMIASSRSAQSEAYRRNCLFACQRMDVTASLQLTLGTVVLIAKRVDTSWMCICKLW